MKLISRFLNTIAGIFRIFVTLASLWGIVFTFFVDRNLLTAFYDLLGFDSISPEIIKIITAIIFVFAFFINLIVTRHIFKANKTGHYHMSNMCFGFIFLLIDLGIYFFTREENLFYLFIFSGILILGSLFGLAAKARGLYPSQDSSDKEEIFKDNTTDVEVENKEEEKDIVKTGDEDSSIDDSEEQVTEKKEDTADLTPIEVKEDIEDTKEEDIKNEKVEIAKETSKPNDEEVGNNSESISEVSNQEEKELQGDDKEETIDETYDNEPSQDLDETEKVENESSTKNNNSIENTRKRENDKE